jgi:predicted DCC family thiol-disulfide oxidoreductase YuxK
MTRSDPDICVYYDSACPLCRREVAFYRRLDRSGRVDWVDVHATRGSTVAPGLTRDAALARLHARNANGSMVSGAMAFAAIWQRLPWLAPFGRLLARRPFRWIAEGGYRLFLRIRPALSRFLRRLERGHA